MRKTILLLLIIISFNTLKAQSTWFWQQPLPTGNFLYSVDFANEQTGYAAGTVGTVIKTTDGGNSWSLKNINTTDYLTSVSAADENTVLASRNNIYRSSNGGDNWTQVYSYTGNVSFFLDFPTRNTGYAAGAIGVILKTTNSGINWIAQTSPVSQAFYDISFSDSLHGIISAFRGVITTTDGGNNWNYVNFNLESFDIVASCSQTDNQNLFAITSFDFFFRSTNGGLNWTSSLLPVDFSNIPRQCSFSNSNKGFIVTSWGNILRTTNAGTSWITDSTFQPKYYKINVLRGVQAFNENTIFVCGAGGKVGKSTNGGITWTSSTDAAIDLKSNYFINENTGYTVGYEGIIMKTTNGGNNWIQQTSNTTQNLNDVYFVNVDVGYVCGDTGTVLKTTNGGNSWSSLSSIINDNLNSIWFTDFEVGIVAGNRGKILRTTNGGNIFNTISSGTTSDLISINFANTNIGYVNSLTRTLKTTNNGENWIIYSGGGNDLCFPSPLIGYTVAGTGTILKTSNGGINWITQSGNVLENLNSVFFLNNDNGFSIGNEGVITKTTNGGINWIPQDNITNNDLKSVYFVNSSTGYICGDFGTLMKTTNGGLVFISSINNLYPEEYSLSQNYPNPFNSSTIIEYKIAKTAIVKIDIYNIEGKQVSILVNENQNIGSYKVLFDASELPNGVYFYNLKADNILIDSKKLLLIK